MTNLKSVSNLLYSPAPLVAPIKMTGVLVGNFEQNPYKVPESRLREVPVLLL